MKSSTAFKDKTLMITGGTGSFGNTVLKHFMNTDLAEIRIFSRDEKKQDDMRHRLQERSPELASKVRFFIGDVRNAQSVRDAMHGVDYIFHARRPQAGALLRVLPHGGRPHQRHRHGQRAARSD